MAIKKQYLKTRPVCKVTFRMAEPEGYHPGTVDILGDFNEWETGATRMEQLKDGTFKAVVELDPDREYAFRYLMDNRIWGNDDAADKYVPTPYGNEENSVIVV